MAEIHVAASVATETTTGVADGMDIDVTVTVDGVEFSGEVTMVPDAINGGWTSYGYSADCWVSGALLAQLLEHCSDILPEVLREIRIAAEERCD